MNTVAELATQAFPADYLPYGVATHEAGTTVVSRVGDTVIDLAGLAHQQLLTADPSLFEQRSLNAFVDAGTAIWTLVRNQLVDLGGRCLQDRSIAPALVPLDAAKMQLPIVVGDYVDFYSSLEHATNLGRLFRPDSEPLLPNWRHLPIGYHGRSGTVVVSGTEVARPSGQHKPPDSDIPVFGPCTRLDIELELGAVLAAPGGVRYEDPEEHLFGLVLVNDWSARDMQAWEYQPLGPFLGKSFATSMSSWVVPLAAVRNYRCPAREQDPTPLPYLTKYRGTNFDINLGIELTPAGSSESVAVSTTNSRGLYWTFAQQIEHMRSNGASIRTGDLIATGTISGPDRGSEGSFIEMTRNGAEPIELPGGEKRSFLVDGDTVRLVGRFGPDGPSLGDCVGTIGGPPAVARA